MAIRRVQNTIGRYRSKVAEWKEEERGILVTSALSRGREKRTEGTGGGARRKKNFGKSKTVKP